MVLGTILFCKMEEVLQLKDAVTEEAGVVSLAYRRHSDVVHEQAKLGILSCG